MVPEILRAVLDADGKRAHLVTPFLEQLLFAEEADILWQVLLLGDAWHCLDEEWREKVRASFREKTAAPDAWSREWTKSLLQEWAVYVTEDRQLLLAGDPIVLHSAYLNQNMEEAVRKHAFVPVYMPLSEYLWFLAAESGRKIPQHFTEQLHEFMQIYRGRLRQLEAAGRTLTGDPGKVSAGSRSKPPLSVQPDGAGTAAWKRNDSGVAGICQLCVGDGDAAHGVKISAAARKGRRK